MFAGKSTFQLFAPLVSLSLLDISAQERSASADHLYQQLCASCHGADLRGGMSSSLVNREWRFGGEDTDLAEAIRDGLPDLGMPAFGDALSQEQIRALVIYIREGERKADREEATGAEPDRDAPVTTEKATFRVEKIAEAENILWAISFLPDASALVTERNGRLWRLIEDELHGPIKGTPEVWRGSQGGLLDVAPHPDYEENGWIYLSFSHSTNGRTGMTKIVRGRIEADAWVNEETIWEAPRELHHPTQHHFGSRIVFRDRYVFFSVGDRGRQHLAQDLSRLNGKIFRLHDDGRIPDDNPFVREHDALPGIWSYGHRNIQGMAIHPDTDALWVTEHGARGGDEVNLIEPSENYGWPEVTHGMNYNGTPITSRTEAPGMRSPELHWTPSIAPCGITFYTGDSFEGWKNNLFVTSLVAQQLHRLVIENGEIVDEEIVLRDRGRIRDVATGPDGHLYLAIEGPDRRGHRSGIIYRLRPGE